MKSSLIVACSCLAVLAGTAEGVSKLTPEERQARKEKVAAIQMRKNGGMVRKTGSMKGRIAIVNAQEKVEAGELEQALEPLRKMLRMDIALVKGEAVNLATAADEFKRYQANMALFVVEDNSIPGTILVMPENGWGILNIAPLAVGVDREKFCMRVLKETVRAFAYVAGAANSQFSSSIMGPIANLRDLDGIDSMRLPPDMQARIFNYAEGFGVTPYVQTTYLNACREGWAPAPTNEFQKAIWDKVHAPPKTPMKIEFDPKKGK